MERIEAMLELLARDQKDILKGNLNCVIFW